MILIFSLLTGCLHKPVSPLELPPLKFKFEISDSIRTSLIDENGEDIEQLADLEQEIKGTVIKSRSRFFPDSSFGDLIQFQDVTEFQQSSPLDGYSIEARSFPDRELLELDLLEHLPSGERLAPLFHALYPVIPDLNPGESSSTQSFIPISKKGSRSLKINPNLNWAYSGKELKNTLNTHHFTYEGDLSGIGKDIAENWAAKIQITGKAKGELWLEKSNNEIFEHNLSWTWTAVGMYVSTDGINKGIIKQEHNLELTLLRAE